MLEGPYEGKEHDYEYKNVKHAPKGNPESIPEATAAPVSGEAEKQETDEKAQPDDEEIVAMFNEAGDEDE